MCDQDAFDDIIQYERRSGLSRRQFGSLAAGAGLMSLLTPVANAAETTGADVEIKTADGTADAYLVHPKAGRHPAVLVWPDIFGLRPTFKQMASRLAESGYSVLVVNPFYRLQKAPTSPEHADFTNQDVAKTLMSQMNSLTPQTVATDAKAFLAWLDTQASVDRKKKWGVTGYCMGGPFTIRVAAQFPDRIGALASFHGASLVTDQPDSPHLLVAKIKASALIAIADNDDQRQPDAKDKLEAAFSQAGLPHTVKVYKGAMHGWCPPDSRAYNHDLAEDAWARQLDLFKNALA
jgi:carboxymethylenebutenolidase